jgi:hypothetical protein
VALYDFIQTTEQPRNVYGVYWAFNFLVNAVILWCACALCAGTTAAASAARAALRRLFCHGGAVSAAADRFHCLPPLLWRFCCTGHIGFKRYVHFTAALYAMTFFARRAGRLRARRAGSETASLAGQNGGCSAGF